MKAVVMPRVNGHSRAQAASPGAPSFANNVPLVSALVSVAVFVMTIVSFSLRPVDSDWAVWRPSVGVAVGVAAWYPRRYSLLIALSAGVATGLASLLVGRPMLVAGGVAIVATVETWVAARLLRGTTGRIPTFSDPQGLRRLMVAGLAVGAITIVGLSAAAFLALGVDRVLPAVGTTAATHILGMLLVAPLFFEPPPALPPIRLRETVAQWSTLTATLLVTFFLTAGIPLAYIILPPLLWGATRLPYRVFLVQLIVTSFAISELSAAMLGPFGADKFGVTERTLLVGSLGVTISIMVFTVIAGAARAANAQASLKAREKWGREAISASVTGVGVLHDTEGQLWLSDLNQSARVTLAKEVPNISDSVLVEHVLAPKEFSAISDALEGVTAAEPTPWTMRLVTTKTGRLLEASMVALTASAPDRASFQFIDVTDRETVRAQYAAERLRAVEIQSALVPQGRLATPGYVVVGRSLASRALGGDFYDWFSRADGFTVSVGDVMGKGTGPSILAATLRTSLRLSGEGKSPAKALKHLARVVEPELSAAASFATVFTANITAESGLVKYADAGHGLALLCSHDGSFTQLGSPDLPLGVMADSEWVDRSARLAQGGTLVIFSDGVLDLFGGTLSAIDEVAHMAIAAPDGEFLIDQIFAHADSESLDDDLTVVVIRRLAASA